MVIERIGSLSKTLGPFIKTGVLIQMPDNEITYDGVF